MLKSAFREVNELGKKKSDEASDEQAVGGLDGQRGRYMTLLISIES
jgi:hypothetical protein